MPGVAGVHIMAIEWEETVAEIMDDVRPAAPATRGISADCDAGE